MADITVSSDKFFLMLWATANAVSCLPMTEHRQRPQWAKAKEVVEYDRTVAELSDAVPTHAQPKPAATVTEENFGALELAKAVSLLPSLMAEDKARAPGERLKCKLKSLVRFDRAITSGMGYHCGNQ